VNRLKEKSSQKKTCDKFIIYNGFESLKNYLIQNSELYLKIVYDIEEILFKKIENSKKTK